MAVLPPPVLPRQTRLLPALLLREEVSAEEEAVPAVTGILEGVGEGITTIAMALYAVGLRKVAGVETEMIVIGVIGMATSTRVEIATIVTCEIESPGLKSIAAPFRTSNHRRLKTSLRLQSHHPRQHLAPYLRATQVYRRLKPSEESENHHQQDRERCLSDRSLRVAANLKVLRPLNLNPFISQMQVLLYQLARELNQIHLRDHQANNGSIQQRPFPIRQDDSPLEYHRDDEMRPRSSHAKHESQLSPINDKPQQLRRSVPPELGPRPEQGLQLSKTPTDKENRPSAENKDVEMGGVESQQAKPKEQKPVILETTKDPATESSARATTVNKPLLRVPVVRFSLPPKDTASPSEAWESDDEDMGDYFADELTKTETTLRELERKDAPWDVATRFASLSHDMALKIAVEDNQAAPSLGPIPVGLQAKAYVSSGQAIEQFTDVPGVTPRVDFNASIAGEAQQSTTGKLDVEMATTASRPSLPKMEEVDASVSSPSAEVPVKQEAQPGSEDVLMAEAPPAPEVAPNKPDELQTAANQNGVTDQPPATDGAAEQSPDDGSQLPTPPSQVDDDGDETESDDPEAVILDSLRQTMKTPPIDSLPNFHCKPWDKDSKFLKTLDKGDPPLEDFILTRLEKITLERLSEQQEASQIYLQNYRNYLDFTLSNDPVAVKTRDKIFGTSTASESLAAAQASAEQKPEGRGGGRRFATERDLERVIQASIKEDEERKQREIQLQKEKYRSEKEAIIPPMYWDEKQIKDELFWDTSGYVPVDRLVYAWECLPPIDNFTEEEIEQFEKRYMEKPKQWGVIAESVPKRDFKACIQFYYLRKKQLNLKEKLKKQPKRRKKSGRGKQRSSALVSELGNGENETEENNAEATEGGERRRPRRAAAPTFSFEQNNAADSDGVASGSGGRRGNAGGSKTNADGEKVDGRKNRRKTAKDKEPKVAKPNQALAVTPTPGPGRGRSRSNSRAQNAETPTPVGATEASRLPVTHEQPSGIQPPPLDPAQQPPPPPVTPVERPPTAQTSSMADLMAPPSALAPPQLRPDPPPPPAHGPTLTFVQPPVQPQPERRAQSQASSYWSVSEITEFPLLLRAFGTDWSAIANHMGSKTHVMVKNYFVRQKDKNDGWEAMVAEADEKRRRGEKRPDPPPPSTAGSKKRHDHTVSMSRPLPVSVTANPEAPTSADSAQAAKTGSNLPQLANQPFLSRSPMLSLGQGSPGQTPPAHSPQKPVPEHAGVLTPQTQAPPAQPIPTAQLQQEPSKPVHPPQAHPSVPQAMSPGAKPYSFSGDRSGDSLDIAQKAPTMHGTDTPPKRALAPMRPSAGPGPQGTPSVAQPEPQQSKRNIAPMRPAGVESIIQQPDAQSQQSKRAIAPMRPPAADIVMQQPEAQSAQSRRALAPISMAQPQPESQQSVRILAPTRSSTMPQATPHAEPPRDRSKMEVPRPIEQRPMHLKQEPDTVSPAGPYDFATHAPLRPSQPSLDARPASPAKRPEWGPGGYGRAPEPTSAYVMAQPQSDGRPPYGDVTRAQVPPSQPMAAGPTPAPPARAPEPKKSSLMALLNDDPPAAPVPAAPKVVSDVASSSIGTASPQPQKMPGHAAVPPPSSSQLGREQEAGYPYSHSSVAPTPSGMPPLKPYQSPQTQHMSIQRPASVMSQRHEPPPMPSARDYYRQPSYPQHHASTPSTPQPSHHHAPSSHSQPAPVPYQGQSAYPPYGSQPHRSAASPPPSQYPMHPPTSRPLEHAPPSRESWPSSGQSHVPQSPAMMTSGLQKPGWPVNPNPKPMQSHGQPPKSWDPVKGAGPMQASWAPTPPPPQQQHYGAGLRGDPYGTPTSMPQQAPPPSAPTPSSVPPHGHMQSQYAPPAPSSREPMSHYPPYGLRPGQGPSHDVRDPIPGRSYTPVSAYDARGPPPPHGGYGAMADPRDPRDPRMQSQMRPHDRYDQRHH
ncbi:hypothetical protein jhhlp_001469 [Lomentospora prolificans]|uniref:SANT domain-containing protein n=1 Tax=Lomentospora prolificans TaxID=41688 RepID=A0A2N3NID7_9PEZI|nr:hypothetical protein jhhlp_001469 [Lomentospora prolificans]